jgi:hypothetical protein
MDYKETSGRIMWGQGNDKVRRLNRSEEIVEAQKYEKLNWK